MATNTLFTKNPTGNRKLSNGSTVKMWATYRPVSKKDENGKAVGGTCPDACPFLAKCYANFHMVGMVQRRALGMADNLIEKISELPKFSLVRHLVSGDFGQNKLDDYLNEAVKAHRENPTVLGFSYTHLWRRYKATTFNRVKNFVVNASCETPDEVRAALAKGYPVCQVVPENTPDKVQFDGYLGIVCPAQTAKKLTCAQCRLCSRQNRKAVILFRAHSSNKADIGKTVISLTAK